MSDIIKLRDPDEFSSFNKRQKLYRDGIELEKGVIINEAQLEKNEELLYDCQNIFAAYPDV